MEPIQPVGCGCTKPEGDQESGTQKKDMNMGWAVFIGLFGFALWYVVYKQLEPFSHFFTYSLMDIEQGSHLGGAIQFFIYDTPKVMMLLTLVVFVIGMLRSFFTQERTRKYLAGKRESAGNVMAALLGFVPQPNLLFLSHYHHLLGSYCAAGCSLSAYSYSSGTYSPLPVRLLKTSDGLPETLTNHQRKEKIMEIKVCGPGCASCEQAKKMVEAAVAAKGVEATITKVTDFAEIAQMGIFSTPAVVVDGEVKCVGRPPQQAEVEEWIA